MNFLRRVFANGLDADLIRLFRMLLPYKGLIALALHLSHWRGKHVVPHGDAFGQTHRSWFLSGRKVGDLRGARQL